jgi:FeS assembly SUF system protein
MPWRGEQKQDRGGRREAGGERRESNGKRKEEFMMNDELLKEKVIEKIQEIFDPEIPVNIWDLGLIYEVNILPINNVQVVMTLTAPSCPAAQSLPHEVDQKIRTIEGVNDVHVEVTWTPAWNKDMMTEVAKLELGFL